MSIESLPDELLIKIIELGRLDARDVCSLSQTCRRMNCICVDDQIWRNLCQRRNFPLVRITNNYKEHYFYRHILQKGGRFYSLSERRIWSLRMILTFNTLKPIPVAAGLITVLSICGLISTILMQTEIGSWRWRLSPWFIAVIALAWLLALWGSYGQAHIVVLWLPVHASIAIILFPVIIASLMIVGLTNLAKYAVWPFAAIIIATNYLVIHWFSVRKRKPNDIFTWIMLHYAFELFVISIMILDKWNSVGVNITITISTTGAIWILSFCLIGTKFSYRSLFYDDTWEEMAYETDFFNSIFSFVLLTIRILYQVCVGVSLLFSTLVPMDVLFAFYFPVIFISLKIIPHSMHTEKPFGAMGEITWSDYFTVWNEKGAIQKSIKFYIS